MQNTENMLPKAFLRKLNTNRTKYMSRKTTDRDKAYLLVITILHSGPWDTGGNYAPCSAWLCYRWFQSKASQHLANPLLRQSILLKNIRSLSSIVGQVIRHSWQCLHVYTFFIKMIRTPELPQLLPH